MPLTRKQQKPLHTAIKHKGKLYQGLHKQMLMQSLVLLDHMKKHKTPTRTFNPRTGVTTVTFSSKKDSTTNHCHYHYIGPQPFPCKTS
jgi:hypothetical protein